MSEDEIIHAFAKQHLPGRVVAYQDDMADLKCVKIRWGTDYWGRVCWSEDETEYKSEHWPDILRIRTHGVVLEMLAMRDRREVKQPIQD